MSGITNLDIASSSATAMNGAIVGELRDEYDEPELKDFELMESGDVLIFDAAVPEGVVVGDILGTAVTGAYGHSMGSNYNKVTRPPVVFVADGEARLVVRRETLDDLLACDIG